jgi:hypothetical protein
MSNPTFVNDEQTTTYTQRRIQMSLDPAAPMGLTLGELAQFVDFARSCGAGEDEPIAIGSGYALVLRHSSSITSSIPAEMLASGADVAPAADTLAAAAAPATASDPTAVTADPAPVAADAAAVVAPAVGVTYQLPAVD